VLVLPVRLVDRHRVVRHHAADDRDHVAEVLVGGRLADLEHQPPVIGDGSATAATAAAGRPIASAIRRPVVTAP